MPETHLPRLTTDRLVAVFRQEIRGRQGPGADVAPCLDVFEILLNVAEERANVRTRLPKKLNRFPFTWSKLLQRLFLKCYNLLFADQREINVLLIKALRQSVAIIRTLDGRLKNGNQGTKGKGQEVSTEYTVPSTEWEVRSV